VKKILILIIKFYKLFISPIFVPIFGPACRFKPTCSEYTLKMINRYGAWRGLYLGVVRLSQCHPYYEALISKI